MKYTVTQQKFLIKHKISVITAIEIGDSISGIANGRTQNIQAVADNRKYLKVIC